MRRRFTGEMIVGSSFKRKFAEKSVTSNLEVEKYTSA